MHYSRSSKVFFLVCFILLLGFAAGCGGTDQDSGSQNGGNNDSASQGESGTSQDAGGETAAEPGGATSQAQGGATEPEIKIALGEIMRIDTERRRVVLRPVEGERQVFRVVPNANVTLDDRPIELADLEKGQSAQIRYIVKNDLGRARTVNAFSASGASE